LVERTAGTSKLGSPGNYIEPRAAVKRPNSNDQWIHWLEFSGYHRLQVQNDAGRRNYRVGAGRQKMRQKSKGADWFRALAFLHSSA
jgi:hypothetical protein